MARNLGLSMTRLSRSGHNLTGGCIEKAVAYGPNTQEAALSSICPKDNNGGPGERIPVGKEGSAAISGLHPSALRAETKESD